MKNLNLKKGILKLVMITGFLFCLFAIGYAATQDLTQEQFKATPMEIKSGSSDPDRMNISISGRPELPEYNFVFEENASGGKSNKTIYRGSINKNIHENPITLDTINIGSAHLSGQRNEAYAPVLTSLHVSGDMICWIDRQLTWRNEYGEYGIMLYDLNQPNATAFRLRPGTAGCSYDPNSINEGTCAIYKDVATGRVTLLWGDDRATGSGSDSIHYPGMLDENSPSRLFVRQRGLDNQWSAEKAVAHYQSVKRWPLVYKDNLFWIDFTNTNDWYDTKKIFQANANNTAMPQTIDLSGQANPPTTVWGNSRCFKHSLHIDNKDGKVLVWDASTGQYGDSVTDDVLSIRSYVDKNLQPGNGYDIWMRKANQDASGILSFTGPAVNLTREPGDQINPDVYDSKIVYASVDRPYWIWCGKWEGGDLATPDPTAQGYPDYWNKLGKLVLLDISDYLIDNNKPIKKAIFADIKNVDYNFPPSIYGDYITYTERDSSGRNNVKMIKYALQPVVDNIVANGQDNKFIKQGDEIAITGRNFGYAKDNESFVVFYSGSNNTGVKAQEITEWKNTSIKCKVPYFGNTPITKVRVERDKLSSAVINPYSGKADPDALPILGDVNVEGGDHVLNDVDIQACLSQIKLGAAYNPKSDMDNNGKVDILDIMEMARIISIGQKNSGEEESVSYRISGLIKPQSEGPYFAKINKEFSHLIEAAIPEVSFGGIIPDYNTKGSFERQNASAIAFVNGLAGYGLTTTKNNASGISATLNWLPTPEPYKSRIGLITFVVDIAYTKNNITVFDNRSLVVALGPMISSVSPDRVTFGSCGHSLTIIGYGFGATQGSGKIMFDNNTSINVISWSDQQIVVNFSKSGCTSSVIGGCLIRQPDLNVAHTVTVVNSLNEESNSYAFRFSDGVCYGYASSVSRPAPEPEVVFIKAPNAPSNLVAKAKSANQIDLQWVDKSTNESDNETGFEIERRTKGVAFAKIATTKANVTTYSDMGLTANTTYEYRVRAVNSAGASAYSSGYLQTTQALPPVKPTISNYAPNTATQGTVITLNGNFGAKQGRVVIYDNGKYPLGVINSWSDTQIKFTVPVLTSSGYKSFDVVNTIGASGWKHGFTYTLIRNKRATFR